MLRLLMIAALIMPLACAEIATPTGGPKDTTAPVILTQDPPQESTQVSPSRIIITFDEYVELKDVFNQVLISPPLPEEPEYRIKGKTLTIILPDSLLSDRTYSLYFGEALRDRNEGNILANFQVVFATGEMLDSLSLRGTVEDALSREGAENQLVLLFSAGDPELLRSGTPIYVTRTDVNGIYQFRYLAPGSYQMLALGDNNFNYRFDLPNERIGFLPQPYQLGSSVEQGPKLLQFEERNGKGELMRLVPKRYGKLEATFRGQAESSSLQIDPVSARQEWSPGKDTLTLWISATQHDSLRIRQQLDTIDKQLTAAIPMVSMDSLRRNTRLGMRSNVPPPAEENAKSQRITNTLHTIGLEEKLLLILANPAAAVRPERILLTSDSGRVNHTIQESWQDSVKRRLAIYQEWDPKTRYALTVLPGAIQDIFGLINDTLIREFRTKDRSAYGRLTWNIQVDSAEAYVMELLTASGAVWQAIKSKGQTSMTWDIPLVPAGTYRLRAIADRNQNGQWDPGDLASQTQPESVTYFTETITVRADWSVSFDWEPKFDD